MHKIILHWDHGQVVSRVTAPVCVQIVRVDVQDVDHLVHVQVEVLGALVNARVDTPHNRVEELVVNQVIQNGELVHGLVSPFVPVEALAPLATIRVVTPHNRVDV